MTSPARRPARARTLALVWGVVLSAVFALASRAAMPTGGHNYLLGIASLLGTAVGSIACAAFLVGLAVQGVRFVSDGRRASDDDP